MANGSETRQLALNSAILQATTVIVLGISFAQSVISTRYLGVYDFGLISLVVTFVAIVNQISDFRIWELISNQIAAHLAKKETEDASEILKVAFFISLFSGAMAVLVCILLAEIFADKIWRQPQLTNPLILFSFSASWAAQTQNAFALLRVDNKYRELAFTRMGLALVGILAVSFIAMNNLGLNGMFLALSSIELISATIGLAVCAYLGNRLFGRSLWRIDVRRIFRRASGLARYISTIWLTSSLLVVVLKADEFILGIVGSPTVVGVYRVIKNFGRLMLSLSDPVLDAIYPQLARLWAMDSRRAIKNIVINVLGIGISFSALAIVLGGTVVSVIIGLIYGEQYAPGNLLAALIMLNTIYIPFLWCGPLFRVSGRIHFALRIEIAVSIISAALLLVLTPIYGAYGAAVGFIAHSVVTSVIVAIHFWRERAFYFGDRRVE
jgi:O-antigen/teichoic acid export membrane protein